MSTGIVYELPVVYTHHKSENIRLMIETLNRLDEISNKIFTNIEKKINSRKETLSSIQQRIEKSKALVNSLKSRTQATTVYSPSVLKANEIKHEKIFKDEEVTPIRTTQIRHEPEEYKLCRYSDPSRFRAEKIQRQATIDRKLAKKARKEGKDESTKYYTHVGLGKIPRKISTVSSLLVFNSNSNCYSDYDSSFDPLLGEVNKEDKDEIDTGIEDSAPPSMTGEVAVFDYENIGLGFKPKTKELKGFENVGLGLKNVAITSWDANFDDETSLLPSSHLPDLPAVDRNDFDDEGAVPTINTGDDDTDIPDAPPMGEDIPPPPPMDGDEDDNIYVDDLDDAPAPPPMEDFGSEGSKRDVEAPPDEIDVDDVPTGPSDSQKKNKKLPQANEGRSDLLASIRNFKLNKLKKIDIKVGKKKRRGPKKSGGVHMTLLSQLSSALMRRRKAMQGKTEDTDTGGNSRGFGEDEIRRPDMKKEGDAPGGAEDPKQPKEKPEDEWSDDDDDDGDEDEWGQ